MKKNIFSVVKNLILAFLCLILVASSAACDSDVANANSLNTSTVISSSSDKSNAFDSSSKSDSPANSNSKTSDSKESDTEKSDTEETDTEDFDDEDSVSEETDAEDSEAEDSETEDTEVSDSSDSTTAESNSSSSRPPLMWGDKPLGEVDSSKTSSLKPNSSYYSSTDFVISSDDSKTSATPYVTVAAQVAKDVCIVAGACAKNTTKINVSGNKVTPISVVPYAGKDNYYFIAQVRYKGATTLKFTAEEKGKKVSATASVKIGYENMTQNYMERSEYSPVIGKNSRMHFYSALLAYSLGTGKVDSNMKEIAKDNIKSIVSAADKVGAETIFLVIPSSADIYNETVPAPYSEFTGQRLHEEFTKIATSCGAKVIYPLDTMRQHRNDGTGYQLYQYTDSHWSTYGAYWGTYDMFNYIGKKFPSAKPRTVSQMEFYTAEMHAGDAVFNFPHNIGFENYYGDGTTNTTKMKELTTLYRRSMPTDTLKQVYNNYNGLYLTNDNAAAATVNNSSGGGLPTALIMRDSFGKVAYDMINDRFKTVYWGEFDNYNLATDIISSKKPDYVIYLYSERNLLKIMLNNSAASILNLK